MKKVGRGRFTFTLADGRSLRQGGRRPGHWGGRGLRAASYDRVRRVPRGRHQRARAARSAASRPSRRSAAGSTRTSTGRPTSSSAAACTAARRSTGTARRPPSSTAPTTRSPTAAARCSRTSSSGDRTGHDPVGWPTFKDWPAPDSLTHEGIYYRWLERSWRGGLRILANLLVENNMLCAALPAQARTPATTWTRSACRPRTCTQIAGLHRRAVRRPRQGLVPHRHRPVRGPQGHQPGQARRGDGHRDLACRSAATSKLGVTRPVHRGDASTGSSPRCKRLGVSQMELTNKFDNAFTGVAGDAGHHRHADQQRQLPQTGSFLRMQHLRPRRPAERARQATSTAPCRDRQTTRAPGRDLRRHLGSCSATRRAGRRPSTRPARTATSSGSATLGERLIRRMDERRSSSTPTT